MPADAMPRPWPTSATGTVRYRREYRDPLGRPMSGTVTLTGRERTADDGAVTVPVAVTVELAAGALDVRLAPDTYTVQAALRTVDGHRANDSDTVTLEAP